MLSAGVFVQGVELGLVILVGAPQLRVFCDSVFQCSLKPLVALGARENPVRTQAETVALFLCDTACICRARPCSRSLAAAVSVSQSSTQMSFCAFFSAEACGSLLVAFPKSKGRP